ncbi:MAG TPA: hypothetical protein VGQ83_04865 [Polyangia bacterium]|jgi:hypothetical protein
MRRMSLLLALGFTLTTLACTEPAPPAPPAPAPPAAKPIVAAAVAASQPQAAAQHGACPFHVDGLKVTVANADKGVAITLAGASGAATAEIQRRADAVAQGGGCPALRSGEGALKVKGAALKVERTATGAVLTVTAPEAGAVEEVRKRAAKIQALNAEGKGGCGLCEGGCEHGGAKAATAGACPHHGAGDCACGKAAGATGDKPAGGCPHAAAQGGAPACPHAATGGCPKAAAAAAAPALAPAPAPKPVPAPAPAK